MKNSSEKKVLSIGRREATGRIGILLGAWALHFFTACRLALSPERALQAEEVLAKEISEMISQAMRTPPAAIPDPERPERFTTSLPITLEELGSVSDRVIQRTQDTYNARSENERVRRSKILSFQRVDPRSFTVTMEFFAEKDR